MGERKVLNKYYPPDFDPSKLPRIRRTKNKQNKVRMMLPMSIQCSTCGNYIYKGTKFNSRKEDAFGETYLGIQKFRFYFKCTNCSAELTKKTDPQNSDYVVELGATRNYEPWRAEDEVVGKEKKKRNAEEMRDAMKALENRTLDSKRKMDILAALDEMTSMNSRHATVSVDAMLEALQSTTTDKEMRVDEVLIRSIFQKPKEIIRRISDEDLEDDGDLFQFASESSEGSSKKKRKHSKEIPSKPIDALTKASFCDSTSNGESPTVSGTQPNTKLSRKPSSNWFQVIRKPVAVAETKVTANSEGKPEESAGLQSICQNYDSDDA